MKKLIALAALITAAPAIAALSVGAKAPNIDAQASLAGEPYNFSLARALKKGPVVLYFYPKAFTDGCTLEAHAFAEATPEFEKAGAMVVGVSTDDIATLHRFSREACRDRFAVASVGIDTVKAYDAVHEKAAHLSSRTSYVIAPNGRIAYVYSDRNHNDHVKNTLAAVRQLKAAKR